MPLDALIEAILFFKGEPVSIKRLKEILARPEEEVREALFVLKEKLAHRGLALLELEDEVALGTQPEASALIEKLRKEELSRDLGKAGVETLAIILYKGPVSRQEIDYIRGVNSSFILRTLLVRGLIDRIPNPADARSFLYKPTLDLLSYLGVSRLEDLPEFEALRAKIEALTATAAEENENR